MAVTARDSARNPSKLQRGAIMFGLDFDTIITVGKALLTIAGLVYSIYTLFA